MKRTNDTTLFDALIIAFVFLFKIFTINAYFEFT